MKSPNRANKLFVKEKIKNEIITDCFFRVTTLRIGRTGFGLRKCLAGTRTTLLPSVTCQTFRWAQPSSKVVFLKICFHQKTSDSETAPLGSPHLSRCRCYYIVKGSACYSCHISKMAIFESAICNTRLTSLAAPWLLLSRRVWLSHPRHWVPCQSRAGKRN